MHEIVVNLHMHSRFSDGHATHTGIAQAAIRADLDAVIITDHNIWVNGLDGYFSEGNKRVLILVGEEIHDPKRNPQKNHLLVIGAGKEVCEYGYDPQLLLDEINQSGGLSFIAHPYEDRMPEFDEEDLGWVDWDIHGFTGIELWNGLSELKSVAKGRLQAIYYAFKPDRLAHGPLTQTKELWDKLLHQGNRVVAVAGSDAHALPMRLGPLRKTIFPYEFHFRSINNHLLVPSPLSGDVNTDRQLILEALRQGHLFIGYDLPHPTRGFHFTAHSMNGISYPGDEVYAGSGITLQVRLPLKTECRLIKDGQVLKSWHNRLVYTYITSEPGVYRVEADIDYLGKNRAWIISNPIYVR